MRRISWILQLDRETATELEALAALGRRRRAPTSLPEADDVDDVVIQQSGFLDLERDSDWIREFNGGVVPGLLQTPRYMRASIIDGAPGLSESVIKSTMALRRRRQLAVRDSSRYEVIVDESVLLRTVGDSNVMHEQLKSILDGIESNAVSFRVVPLEAGAHPGVNSMFVALQMREELAPAIVFLEGLGGHLKFERSEEIDRFDRVWSHLESLAERSGATVERLTRLIAHYGAHA